METKLISYLRKKGSVVYNITEKPDGLSVSKQISKGQKKGIVVATGKGIIGWSMCDNKDAWDQEKGMLIALRRAALAATMSERDRKAYYVAKVPATLLTKFEETLERSNIYFK